MIREHLISRTVPTDRWFRWRGGAVSRIEALTDAVFGFALTLLVITLEVPRTTTEMWAAVRQIPAFFVCFAMIMMLWFFHYLFFRRYGLEDAVTFLLNAVFLFLVLIYVYPLRLLFTWLLAPLVGAPRVVALDDGTVVPLITAGDTQALMIFYGAGCAALFLVFVLMHLHALRLRRALELDEIEILLTKASIRAHAVVILVAAVSIGLAAAGGNGVPLSGLVYFLIWPLEFFNGWREHRRIEPLLERHRAAPDL